jgi:hypothetical protein
MNFPFQPEIGIQTSTLMSESFEGFMLKATRQKAGRFVGATSFIPAGGGTRAFVNGAGCPEVVWLGATGSRKAPAATVCATVIVASGSPSEARLSHEVRAADTWLKGTATSRIAGNATPAIFMVYPAGKEQTAEVPRSVLGYARGTSVPHGPVNWPGIEALQRCCPVSENSERGCT